MSQKRLLRAWLSCALVALTVMTVSACTKPEFVPVDEESDGAFVILKGYLKRRDGQLEKSNTTVKRTESGYIFRWQTQENERFFRVEKRDTAWHVVEISTASETATP